MQETISCAMLRYENILLFLFIFGAFLGSDALWEFELCFPSMDLDKLEICVTD
jgi:hypothetical protein